MMISRESNHETGLPRILYKYVPPERIDILENLQVRFGRPTDFNDRFDTAYLVPKSHGIPASAARFHLKNRLGVFCLTERSDNHLMWVHYADNHAGFILGFNTSAPFFSENGRILDKVIYQSRPSVFPEPNLRACFYKANVWAYEQEWRCVREFQPSDSRMETIEPTFVSQIIFGSRMESGQRARIVSCVTGYGMTDIHYFISAPSYKSWTFENNHKKLSLCDKCAGNGFLVEESATGDEKIENR
jgi:hypothetical protein